MKKRRKQSVVCDTSTAHSLLLPSLAESTELDDAPRHTTQQRERVERVRAALDFRYLLTDALSHQDDSQKTAGLDRGPVTSKEQPVMKDREYAEGESL